MIFWLQTAEFQLFIISWPRLHWKRSLKSQWHFPGKMKVKKRIKYKITNKMPTTAFYLELLSTWSDKCE